MCTCIHVCVSVFMYVYLYSCMCTCIHVCVPVFMYVYLYSCMCTSNPSFSSVQILSALQPSRSPLLTPKTIVAKFHFHSHSLPAFKDTVSVIGTISFRL